MNVRSILQLTLLLIVSNSVLAEGELDFRISDDTIGGGISSSSYDSSLNYGFEHFYRDEGDSINISNINLHARGQTVIANLPATVDIGAEATYMKEGNFKGSAIAFGANLRMNLPTAPGVSLEGRAHYAPDIVAFGDSDRFLRLRTQVNYRVIQNADISAGYQYLSTGIKNGGDRTFESGLYLGMKLIF
jgi:hypothetical protein